MEAKRRTKVSKAMSHALRHAPDRYGLVLDEQGWVPVDALLAGLRSRLAELTLEALHEVVHNSPKQRFELRDGRIRARQGHSVPVALGYAPMAPPTVLYHGTPTHNRAVIEAEGLKKMARHHVHLSADVETAAIVGRRRGEFVIFVVRAAQLASERGADFFRTGNEVWLVDEVPAVYLTIHDNF